MIVGQNMSLFVDDKPRTHTSLRLLFLFLTKETVIKITKSIGRTVLTWSRTRSIRLRRTEVSLRRGLCFCLCAHINHSGVLLFCDLYENITREWLGITA